MSSPTIRCIQDKHNVDLEELERPAMIQFNSRKKAVRFEFGFFAFGMAEI